MTKSTIILIGAIAIAGPTASLVIHHQAQLKLRENDALLLQQDNQLTELAAEHQRLSNSVVQATSTTTDDPTVELVKLRTEAEALRKQTNELGKQLAENRWSRQWRPASRPDSGTGSNRSSSSDVVSDSNSEEYKEQLYGMTTANGKMDDARNLSRGVRFYAREHQGEFPSNFDQAAPYFYKDQKPPRTSEFELVFQGSLNDLTNVPLQAVALIREQQAWPTPVGKLGRIYVMADGQVNVVESDDNFQSWEAAHIIPPPAARQQ